MRTLLRKAAMTAAVTGALALPGVASAQTFLNNWFFDADGVGGNAPTLINEYFDIVGNSYIQLTPTGGDNFTFLEDGIFVVQGHDGGIAVSADRQITATFTDGAGTGSFDGPISFTPGVGILNVYSDASFNYGTPTGIYGADDGTLIGTFVLSFGEGTVDPSGIPNGELSLALQATSLTPGFFIAPDGTTDLSTLVDEGLIFGFVTTNASFVENPSATLVSELSELVGAPIVNDVAAGSFIVSNNGQFRLSTVPEPGVAALLGLGMLGFWVAGRRRMR